nr:tRNA/rRNA methyltransferase (SpoU) family protein [Tanacetum cinerariifolium]
ALGSDTNVQNLLRREKVPFNSSFHIAGCVAVAASGISKPAKNEAEKCDEAPRMKSDTDTTYYNKKAALLDVFRFTIESSKQHFNPNYRLKDFTLGVERFSAVVVSEHVIQEFQMFNNSKSARMASGSEKQGSTCPTINVKLMKNLDEFPKSFVNHSQSANEIVNYDDEDLETWEVKAKDGQGPQVHQFIDTHPVDQFLQHK